MKQFPDHLADRFRRFKYRHFAPNIDHYEKLAAEGQSPEVMVVSCCDSRVDPETLFSAMPGELFVVRNVANLVPPFETQGKYHGVSAALEFAALNLRVKDIVVLGHSGCGGVRACLEHSTLRQTQAQFIVNWVSMLDDAREAVMAAHPGDDAGQLRPALEREGSSRPVHLRESGEARPHDASRCVLRDRARHSDVQCAVPLARRAM